MTCDALRSGQQTINLTVDPDRAAALIAKAKSMPGVVAAGWTTGVVEMDRAIRFSAADWRDGDKVNRDKLAAADLRRARRRRSRRSPRVRAGAPTTGKLKLTLQAAKPDLSRARADRHGRGRGLVSPDKPGGSDHLMLWIGNPVTTHRRRERRPQAHAGRRIHRGDEEGDSRDDTGSIEALAKELKGQRWDADKSVWK